MIYIDISQRTFLFEAGKHGHKYSSHLENRVRNYHIFGEDFEKPLECSRLLIFLIANPENHIKHFPLRLAVIFRFQQHDEYLLNRVISHRRTLQYYFQSFAHFLKQKYKHLTI